jgi:hypothetical protein
VGSRFTLHTTPHLCWCLTVFASTPSRGLGTFHQIELSLGSLWSRHLRELLSYQNPHRSNQLWHGFVRVSYLALEHIALGLGDPQDHQLFPNPPAHRSMIHVYSSSTAVCIMHMSAHLSTHHPAWLK